MQRNWIGRSIGADVDFAIEGREEPRHGVHDPPRHAVRRDLHGRRTRLRPGGRARAPDPPTEVRSASRPTWRRCRRRPRSSASRTDRAKTGVFLDRFAINPVNGERLPIWAADYVLADYGHGAIMAVPAHDQRDLDFARAFDLPVRVVVDTTAPITGAMPDHRAGRGRRADHAGRLLDDRPGGDRRRADRRGPHGQLRQLNGLSKRNAIARVIEGAGGGRHRPRREELPAARLADLAPALLGHADPDHARRDGWRDRAGAGGAAAGASCPASRAWT